MCRYCYRIKLQIYVCGWLEAGVLFGNFYSFIITGTKVLIARLQTTDTLTGIPDSQRSFNAYPYAPKMIIWESVLMSELSTRDFPKEADFAVKQLQVRCCHCDKSFGPYTPAHITSSCYIHHFQKNHRHLPETKDKKRAIIKSINWIYPLG